MEKSRTEVGSKIGTIFLCRMDRLLKERERELERQGEDKNRLDLKIKIPRPEKGTEINMGQKL